jgi:ankyrin repeat protein
MHNFKMIYISFSKHGTGLHIACSHGNLQIVNYLLLAGADSSLCGPDKQTCLHLAAAGGHLDVLKALVYNKTSVNVSDRNGMFISVIYCLCVSKFIFSLFLDFIIITQK